MSKIKFDVVISDISTPLPYEERTIRESPLGGTEASVIRMAEGLAKEGFTIAVLIHNQNPQHKLQGPKYSSKGTVYYLPLELINGVETDNYVALRSAFGFELFPKARKFSWHEDVWNLPIKDELVSAIKHHKAKVVAVSKWHEEDINSKVKGLDTCYIYNICPDECYQDVNMQYDKNQMCWIASPHKGLEEGLEIFKKVRDAIPNMRLLLFNPGYMNYRVNHVKGLINYGPKPAPEVWKHVRNSLCVFYPTDFLETFGCIAAEANALGVPIVTNKIGALQETVSSENQFIPTKGYAVDRIEDWYHIGRPVVKGQDRFKEEQVIKRWKKLFQL